MTQSSTNQCSRIFLITTEIIITFTFEKLQIYYPCDPTTLIPKTSKTSPVSLILLPHIFLWAVAVNKYFHRISSVSQSVRIFRTYQQLLYFFPYRGQNDRNETKLTCNRGFRWLTGSTSNDAICRPGVTADMDPPSQIWTPLPNVPFKHCLYHT